MNTIRALDRHRLLLALLAAVVLLAGCGEPTADDDRDDEPRYVLTGDTRYDREEGDYDPVCLDTWNDREVDDDYCQEEDEGGHGAVIKKLKKPTIKKTPDSDTDRENRRQNRRTTTTTKVRR